MAPQAQTRAELQLQNCTVLFGKDRGKYPEGNSLVVRGAAETVIVDPSLGVVARAKAGEAPPAAARVLLSHCHEDHFAGAYLYPHASAHVHSADLPGWQSFAGLLAIYGETAADPRMHKMLREQFHYVERPDARPFADGDVFELGGGVRLRVIHTPGHTRGHCAFFVEPDALLYLGDIDLSSFGPYYGDAWSSLECFERSLQKVRGIKARHYATFHHIGVLNRADFLARWQRFAAVIPAREKRLWEFLQKAPRTLEEIAAHHFVYRPESAPAFAPAVERRSMAQHLERWRRQGRVREIPPGRFAVA